MTLQFITEVLQLVDRYNHEAKRHNSPENDIESFKKWIARDVSMCDEEVDWEGKENNRSADSVISTMIVRMNRYGKNYFRAAIEGSDLASTDDMIYLITLEAFGPLTKSELIRKNVHDKSAGMSIINRLIKNDLAAQTNNPDDARSKVVELTTRGRSVLEQYMAKVRDASKIVTAQLTRKEKLILIDLFKKLDDFHFNMYNENVTDDKLLNTALDKLNDEEK